MRIVVLGAAAGGGFPQWNCNCAVCGEAWAGRAPALTQSSLAVSNDGRRWVLLNASPDLRAQIVATPCLRPRQAPRHSPLSAVVLTNGDIDHVAGLLSLRERQKLSVYASRSVLRSLAGNSIFNVLSSEAVERRALAAGEKERLRDREGAELGLAIEGFGVPGKVPLWLEGSRASEAEDTIGLRVEDAGGNAFFYVPGCAAIDEPLARRLRGAALVFFDGTLWRDDEMIRTGLGEKTGRRMGHVSMSGADGAIAAFRALDVGRKVFIHINNTNPVLCAGSPEREEVEAAGWEVARDGMELSL